MSREASEDMCLDLDLEVRPVSIAFCSAPWREGRIPQTVELTGVPLATNAASAVAFGGFRYCLLRRKFDEI